MLFCMFIMKAYVKDFRFATYTTFSKFNDVGCACRKLDLCEKEIEIAIPMHFVLCRENVNFTHPPRFVVSGVLLDCAAVGET